MSSSKNSPLLLIGTLVDTLPDWSLRIRSNALIAINEQGTIVTITSASSQAVATWREKLSLDENQIITLESSEFVLPGFIDSHIHASQFPNSGIEKDMGLLEWLQIYTFPMEKRLAFEEDFARIAYNRVVETTLACGTTAAAYYATIGRSTSELLCDVAEELGQRALVGKVCMNRNTCSGYEETTKEALEDTAHFVESILARKSSLVAPVITPRFAVSCDRELLEGLGDMIKKYDGIRVQTHLSECLPEVTMVKELEPWATNYCEVYRAAGILTKNTILAHSIYLDDSELSVIKEFGAGLSHCPNSNCSMGAGTFDIMRVKKSGIKVGLGTDCSGGYSPSILDSIRFAISTANFLHIQHANAIFKETGEVLKFSPPLDFRGALYLATRGSALVTNLDETCGFFEVGMKFDALRIRMGHQEQRLSMANRVSELFGHESIEDIIQKFLLVGDDRNIVQVFVHGRCVKNFLSNS